MLGKDKIKKIVKELKDEFTYRKDFKKRSYYNTVKIWEKYGKFRIYVPASAYETSGYITLDENDVRGYHSGEYRGFYYSATRPGTASALEYFIDRLLEIGDEK